MWSNDELNRTDMLLNNLAQERSNHAPWIQRKEIAAWSAVVFYVGIYWVLFNFIGKFDGTNLQSSEFWITCITMVASTLLTLIFGAIIHSQYASIYDSDAYANSLQKIFYEIIDPKLQYDLNFDFSESLPYPKFIEIELNIQKKIVQPFIGEKHPLKILYHFWGFNWIRKNEERKIKNREKQEASIYSILMIFYILYICFAATKI